MNYYLAIDIGASSGRHLIGWLEEGMLRTEEIYRFQNGPIEADGVLRWDAERLYTEILNGLKRAGELGKTPCSVGIDTWGVDYALLDEKDELIDFVFCYRDGRTADAIPKVHGIIPFTELYQKTGIQFESFNTVYQLYADKCSGKMDKAKSMLMLPDYFAFRLTGIKNQEYTNATTTGMVNATTHTWDEEIIERLGYKKELFLKLTMPGAVIGEVTEAVADYIGYKTKIICPATHDTASAVLAAPLESRAPYISSGTWSLLGVEEEYAHTDKAAELLGYSNEGSINFNFRLQKNIMGLWMIQQVRHETGDKYSFQEMADMARVSATDAEIDVNDHRFFAPKSMTNEICHAVGRELSVGEISYVIYNNLARSYAKSLSDLEEITGKKYTTLNIIGGGSKNTFLNELTAKYTKKKIIAGPAEGTAIGNIMIQMIGCGELADIQCGRKIIKKSFDITEIGE
jgi:rhamnulokinase